MTGVDVTRFNVDTPVHVQLGGFMFDAVLGEDRQYTPGATTAQFVRSTVNDYYCGFSFEEGYLLVKCRWDAEKLRISIKALTRDLDKPLATSIAAENFVAQPTGDVSDLLGAKIQIASAQSIIPVPAKGRVATRFPYIKRSAGREIKSSVRLRGAAED